MKIGHFSFSSFGGAGQVASALHEDQLDRGLDSSFFFTNMENLSYRPFKHPLLTSLAIGDRYLVGKKQNPSMFSFLRSQHKFRLLRLKMNNLDIVHLHWIPGIIRISDLNPGTSNMKKYFWSIQDMWPFTGGCHYVGDCNKFLESCTACPQVNVGFKSLIKREFDRKLLKLKSLENQITLVFPSQFIAHKARKSKILSDFKSVIIGNPIKINLEITRSSISRIITNSVDKKPYVIGLVAGDLSEKRKNVLELISWWRRNFNYLQSNISILLIGNNGGFASGIKGITVISGIKGSKIMNDIYSTMNLHISLSREETFGYTVIESGLMGIPSICYSNTAQSELIEDHVSGFVIDKIEDLKPLLDKLLPNKEFLQKVGLNAKKNFESNYNQNFIGDKFLNLYSSNQ